jgi:RecB family endonuclease NucS
VIARCQVDYLGRLTAHLPTAVRLLLVKADGSVSVHADGGAYKPLNWMSPPCTLAEQPGRWTVTARTGEQLIIEIDEVLHDSHHELGIDPGLVKDGVEAHLQALLAEHVTTLGAGWTLVRREFPTAIGPVDLLCRDTGGVAVAMSVPPEHHVDPAAGTAPAAARRGRYWAVEVKRKATIDAVEQLTRYLELLNRDPLLAPIGGVLAAQSIAPQARTLAEDRGIRCVILDYDALRGMPSPERTLF